MDSIKGFARRATQTVREKVHDSALTDEDRLIDECTKKVKLYEKASITIGEKVTRFGKLMEELGTLLKEISDDYRAVPDRAQEAESMCENLGLVGVAVTKKAQELQATLKDHVVLPLALYAKEIPKLRDVEEDRRKKQLEYEFFRHKVVELRKSPPKDSTRIPRNESILENWRVELWRSTETQKAAISALYAQGMQVVDRSVLVIIQTAGNYLHSSATSIKQQLFNAKLPVYATGPKLLPAALPPNPLPPFQQPAPVGGPTWQQPQGWTQPGAPYQQQYAPGQYQQPPQQPQQPPMQQQQPPQQYYSAPPPQGYYSPPPQGHQPPPQQQQYQQPPPHQQAPQQQPQPHFGSPAPSSQHFVPTEGSTQPSAPTS